MKNVIEKTIDELTTNKKTKKVYRSRLNQFFNTIGIEDINNYPNMKRDFVKDLNTYAESLKDRPQTTQQASNSVVKQFFIWNKIKVDSVDFKRIVKKYRLTNSVGTTDDRIPNHKELKEILMHADLKKQVLVNFLKDTGLRIEEAVLIQWDDIDMELRKINVRHEVAKGGYPRFTFFTEETKELLKQWNPKRFDFFKSKIDTSHFVRKHLEKQGFTWDKLGKDKTIYKDGKEFTAEDFNKYDNSVFPYSQQNAETMFRNLLENAGAPYNEKDTNPRLKYPRYKIHLHCIRKFFFLNFQCSGANKSFIDFIGGHQSQLDQRYIYFKDRWQQLKQDYDNYSSCLSVNPSDKKIIEINERLQEKDNEIDDMHRRLLLQEEIKKKEIELLEQRLNKKIEESLKKGKLNVSPEMNDKKREKIMALIQTLMD